MQPKESALEPGHGRLFFPVVENIINPQGSIDGSSMETVSETMAVTIAKAKTIGELHSGSTFGKDTCYVCHAWHS